MSDDTASVTRLFVYGTLLRGERAQDLMADGVFVESAVTEPRFTLVDLDDYPALVDFGTLAVHGEVYLVNTTVLLRLDEYEGGEYVRQTVKLQNSKPASAYIWTAARFDRYPTIASGDWRKR
jgi:gamma-glutamylaminecyclotransferase